MSLIFCLNLFFMLNIFVESLSNFYYAIEFKQITEFMKKFTRKT